MEKDCQSRDALLGVQEDLIFGIVELEQVTTRLTTTLEAVTKASLPPDLPAETYLVFLSRIEVAHADLQLALSSARRPAAGAVRRDDSPCPNAGAVSELVLLGR